MSADFSKIICCVRVVFVALALVCFCGAFVFAEDVDTQKNQAQQENAQQEDAQQENVQSDDTDQLEDDAETPDENSVVERFYHDSLKRLRLFNYGEETFVLDSSYNGRSTFVTRDDDRILRRYYDDALRLKKIETWNIKGGVKDAAIVALEEFEYSGNSIYPSSSSSISETAYSATTYDENGKPTLIRLFSIATDDENPDEKNIMEAKNRERILESVSSWKYSEEGKMIESSFQKMESDGKKVAFSRRETYSYKNSEDEDVPPDYEFYEDEQLRTKIVYKNSDNYEMSYFFDGGYVVTETFEDGKKISDLVMQNGSFVRGQNYER